MKSSRRFLFTTNSSCLRLAFVNFGQLDVVETMKLRIVVNWRSRPKNSFLFLLSFLHISRHFSKRLRRNIISNTRFYFRFRVTFTDSRLNTQRRAHARTFFSSSDFFFSLITKFSLQSHFKQTEYVNNYYIQMRSKLSVNSFVQFDFSVLYLHLVRWHVQIQFTEFQIERHVFVENER